VNRRAPILGDLNAARTARSTSGDLRIEDLGVAVLAYGRSNSHAELLDSLREAGMADDQLVVVHNPDRPSDGWQPLCPEAAELIALERNAGYPVAMNRAIEAFARRGVTAVLLLTHDVRVEPTTLRVLVDTANAAPDYGVLGLAVNGAGGAPTSYGSYLRSDGSVEHVSARPAGDIVADSVFVDGCSMFVRLAASGTAPLPEHYFMYFEEAVLCSTVRANGWRVGTALNAAAASVSGIKHRRGAFHYLYVRNGLDWVYRERGVGAAARYAAHELWRALAGLPKPGGRRSRDPVVRRAGFEQIIGRALGIIDFARRRWGPPPDLLRRMSDIHNV
jgi:GT2 family glycosyltransferase